MSLTEKEVVVCNQALDRIGSKNFTYATQASANEGIKSALHYETTRNSLSRSFEWPFASWRAKLVLDTKSPDFEWDNQFTLPEDYIRVKSDYQRSSVDLPTQRFAIEGNKYLTDQSDVEIRYIRKVTDPDDFDPLFKEILILQLAMKLINSLAGTGTASLKQEIKDDLKTLISRARQVCKAETNQGGYSAWNNARL